jgi:hypothetical protein
VLSTQSGCHNIVNKHHKIQEGLKKMENLEDKRLDALRQEFHIIIEIIEVF